MAKRHLENKYLLPNFRDFLECIAWSHDLLFALILSYCEERDQIISMLDTSLNSSSYLKSTLIGCSLGDEGKVMQMFFVFTAFFTKACSKSHYLIV